jgi:hypothetical protein
MSGHHAGAAAVDVAVTTGRVYRRRVVRAITAAGAPVIEYRTHVGSTFLVGGEFAASVAAMLSRR